MRLGLRWIVFLVFLAASVVLTVALWPHGAFLFLVFPFFFPWRRRSPPPETRACPRCGWSTAAPDERFCPRDGEALAPRSGERF